MTITSFMSRTKRFLDGVSLGYAGQVLITITGLWLTPFLLRRIGQHDFGLWLVGTQLFTYLTLMDFGIVTLLTRDTAYAAGRAGSLMKVTDLPEIIGQIGRMMLWQMPLVALAATILWWTIPAEWEALRLPIGLVMFSFVLAFPFRIFHATLQGLQDFAFLGTVSICTWLISTYVSIGLVLAGFGLYALAIGWMVTQIASPIIFWFRFRHRYPGVMPRCFPAFPWPALPWNVARDYISKGFWVSLAQVAQVLVAGTDILIIGKLLGPLAVVPFACTGKLISVLSNQPQMLMEVAGPVLSEMKMGEPRWRLFEVCTALTQAMMIISGAVACIVLTVNRGFVTWWVGSDKYGGLDLSAMLLLVMLLRHWNTTAVYAIFYFGYERRISVLTLLDGCVTVCGAVILVWLLGPIGAPLGMVMGVCLVSLPGNLSALARENGVSVGTLIRSLWPWFWRFSALAVGAWIIARVLMPQTFFTLALTSAAVALIYFTVMLPIGLREPLGIYVRPRFAMVWMRLFGTPHTSLANDADA